MRRWSCPYGTWEAVSAPACASLPGVLGYRGFRLDLDRHRRWLELPAGTASLVVIFDGEVRLSRPGAPGQTRARSFTLFFAGPQTSAALCEHDGRVRGIDVIFAPWAAFGLLRVAMRELVDNVVRLESLIGSRALDLADRLDSAGSWPECFRLLDALLTCWNGDGTGWSPQVARAWGELTHTDGTKSVSALAAAVGWSVRQLQARFREQVGLTPKAAARVLRLQHALGLLKSGLPLADVASTCAFHDQAHLSHEIKAMTGRTPLRLMSEHAAGRSRLTSVDRLGNRISSIILDT